MITLWGGHALCVRPKCMFVVTIFIFVRFVIETFVKGKQIGHHEIVSLCYDAY